MPVLNSCAVHAVPKQRASMSISHARATGVSERVEAMVELEQQGQRLVTCLNEGADNSDIGFDCGVPASHMSMCSQHCDGGGARFAGERINEYSQL